MRLLQCAASAQRWAWTCRSTPARATAPLFHHCARSRSTVSALDDNRKIAISRLGNQLRVAGTIELGGFDSRSTPVAKARCHAVTPHRRVVPRGVRRARQPSKVAPAVLDGPAPRHATNILSLAARAWASCG